MIITHELLHTTPIGDMRDVNDPVNLMHKEQNSVNILRHRTIKKAKDNTDQNLNGKF